MATETQAKPSREELENGRIYAAIMNLIEDTRKKEEEREKLRAETRKLELEMRKEADEREKLRAEAMKLQVEAQTFKLRHIIAAYAAAVIFVAALVAAVKAFL